MSEEKQLEWREAEMAYRYAKADVHAHEDFIELRLYHWRLDEQGQPVVAPGLVHQVLEGHAADLLADLQEALQRLASGNGSKLNEPRH